MTDWVSSYKIRAGTLEGMFVHVWSVVGVEGGKRGVVPNPPTPMHVCALTSGTLTLSFPYPKSVPHDDILSGGYKHKLTLTNKDTGRVYSHSMCN